MNEPRESNEWQWQCRLLYMVSRAAGALLHHLMEGAQVLAHSLTVDLIGTSAHMSLDAGRLLWVPAKSSN